MFYPLIIVICRTYAYYLFSDSLSTLASLSLMRQRRAVSIWSGSELVLVRNSKAIEAVSPLSL